MSKLNYDEIKDWYVSNFNVFENNLNGSRDVPFHKVRKSAIAKFESLGFPARRHEEWKYTNITPLLKEKLPLAGKSDRFSAADLDAYTFEGLEKNLLVFVNGQYSQALSNYKNTIDGVIIENLSSALSNHSDLIAESLSRYANYDDEAFVALNTAFANDGLFIYVPDNTEVEAPLHLLHLTDSSDGAFFSNTRHLIVAGKNSRLKVVESHHGIGKAICFNNFVSEVVVMNNARVDHVKLQDEHAAAYHIYNLQAHQEKESVYSLVNIDIGGKLTRNSLNVALKAEHCEGHLIGFYMGSKKQHIDNHTAIDHAMPNCYSNEIYKGILGGKASGVFNGKIFVRQDAQKTNAYQDNKALLLSDDAKVNTKPQLEIFADDVKCSHGATVGQLDEEAIFYLRSRGIPQEKAQSMMQYAFASDVFEYIPIASVREKIDHTIFERFKTL